MTASDVGNLNFIEITKKTVYLNVLKINLKQC